MARLIELGAAVLALASAPGRAAIQEAYGRLPLAFEENRGQTHASVRYFARAGGYAVAFSDREVILATLESPVRMKMLGAQPNPRLEGLDRLPGGTNYFLGNDSSRWREGVPSYSRVRYRALYPGIDLVVYGSQGSVEYDWVVAPGADPARIRLRFEGASGAGIESNGDLVLRRGEIRLRHRKPFAYQERGGERQAVASRFAPRGAQEFGLEVGPYDSSRPLYIDPVLVYTALPGDRGASDGYGIAVDKEGSAYFIGRTLSMDLPGTTTEPRLKGDQDIFVGKLDPSGTRLLYATYIGNALDDRPSGIAVDAAGNAYITGWSGPGFPVRIGGLNGPLGVSDAFVAKLNPTGGLAYSMLVGGSQPDGAYGIALDAAGNAYVAGSTRSADFPTRPGAFRTEPVSQGRETGFVVKVSPDGLLVNSTLLGGSRGEIARAIAADSAGNSYVAGQTYSPDFPVTPGAFQTAHAGALSDPGAYSDAFVTKLNPSGSALVYSTFLGGSWVDEGHGIALDPEGNAYVTGYTTSDDFPVKDALKPSRMEPNGGFLSAFVTKLNPSGSSLVYSSYLGPEIVGYGIAVDSRRRVHVVGAALSNNGIKDPLQIFSLPQIYTCDLPPYSIGRCSFAAVSVLEASGRELVYSTAFGSVVHFGRAVAVDPAGNTYLTGLGNRCMPGGLGSPTDGRSLFVAKIAPTSDVPPFFTPQSVTNSASFQRSLSPGGLVTIFGKGLTSVTGVRVADKAPLPTELEGTQVLMNGVAAPILAVANVDGREQINVQAPFELLVDPYDYCWPLALVEVRNRGVGGFAFVETSSGGLWGRAGIFTSEGRPLILHAADWSLVDDEKPAERGEVLVMYATGLGVVDPPGKTGIPAPASPLSRTVRPWTVSVGGTPAELLFSGLAPGYIGLYQVNFRVPEGISPGYADVFLYDVFPNDASNVARIPLR